MNYLSCIALIFSWLILNLFVIQTILAEDTPAPPSDMETRSQQPHTTIKEPPFVTEQSLSREQGMYFGLGWRRVQIEILDKTFTNSDGEANGIALNVGGLFNEKIIEYSRHASFIETEKEMTYKGQTVTHIEVIQNNYWLGYAPFISKNWLMFFGGGLQFGQIRLIGTNQTVDDNGTTVTQSAEKLVEVNSIVTGIGLTYFISDYFLVHYRFNRSFYSSLLTGDQDTQILPSSQMHTLFWEYYLPL